MTRVRTLLILPESDEASRGLLRTARKLLDKIKAKIPMISQSLTGRGKMIVETAVKNDKRPDASLAANNTAKIYNDPTGAPYSQIGAKSSRHLVQTIGPPPLVKDLPVPRLYANPLNGKFKGNLD